MKSCGSSKEEEQNKGQDKKWKIGGRGIRGSQLCRLVASLGGREWGPLTKPNSPIGPFLMNGGHQFLYAHHTLPGSPHPAIVRIYHPALAGLPIIIPLPYQLACGWGRHSLTLSWMSQDELSLRS